MILCDKTGFKYETEALSREFFPRGELCLSDEYGDDNFIVTKFNEDKVIVKASYNGKKFTDEALIGENSREATERLLYTALSNITGKKPLWGTMTGVRPVKQLFTLLDKGISMDSALEYLKTTSFISDKKLSLLKDTALMEMNIRKESAPFDFSMYISVPFCPTRCSYCSFTAVGIEKAEKLIPTYVDLLCKEIEETANLTKKLGLRLKTLYMGGGTPTTLSAEEIKRVLGTVKKSFCTSFLEEITVEAGRPDTITPQKLDAIRSEGVKRISINPQTMNDDVLKIIGRNHTEKDIIDAFNLAREKGFDFINMDLISGLPGDSFESFCDSVEKVIRLGPENITLHTLTLKRGSNLKYSDDRNVMPDVEKMNEYAYMRFYESGYKPYYLYRQKGTIDNLENVGFSKEGYECKYNVYIMDETHSVISCGAGGSTILKDPVTGHIERIYNFKFPFEYIDRFGGIEEKKGEISKFYDNCGDIKKEYI